MMSFLTNVISKVYERVVKSRNEEEVRKKSSQWQMGGVKKRSTTDNLFILYGIIERNHYLKKPTYILYSDAEKCFDKLWLDDAVVELWIQGTNVRDAVMIKKMNEEAHITIQTPVGNTNEIIVGNIVRQGTVYGPNLCGASMSRVNDVGKDIVTFYGPKLIIRATQFVDDITGAGSVHAVNNTITNCNMLEETKKMTFNNTNGKTEYSISHPTAKCEIVTSNVKKGRVERVKEHKALGMWIDERGTYMINIEKNEKRVPHMIETVRVIGSTVNLGRLAIATRMKLVNTVIMPSLLYNVEVVPKLTKEELKQLEKMQKKVLSRLLEVPSSTPYFGILMETGMWTVEARIAYRKLMLFHNLMHSEDDRVTKNMLMVQEQEDREGTWFSDVRKKLETYEIIKDVNKVLKSEWKKEVKEKISNSVEKQVRAGCANGSKTRTVIDDAFELKEYLQETNVTEASDILKTRLHMTKLTCNYRQQQYSPCPLCGYPGKVTTEHYFRRCTGTNSLSKIWETNEEDLKGTFKELRRAKNHLQKIEVMMEPYMAKYDVEIVEEDCTEDYMW